MSADKQPPSKAKATLLLILGIICVVVLTPLFYFGVSAALLPTNYEEVAVKEDGSFQLKTAQYVAVRPGVDVTFTDCSVIEDGEPGFLDDSATEQSDMVAVFAAKAKTPYEIKCRTTMGEKRAPATIIAGERDAVAQSNIGLKSWFIKVVTLLILIAGLVFIAQAMWIKFKVKKYEEKHGIHPDVVDEIQAEVAGIEAPQTIHPEDVDVEIVDKP